MLIIFINEAERIIGHTGGHAYGCNLNAAVITSAVIRTVVSIALLLPPSLLFVLPELLLPQPTRRVRTIRAAIINDNTFFIF